MISSKREKLIVRLAGETIQHDLSEDYFTLTDEEKERFWEILNSYFSFGHNKDMSVYL